MKKFIALILIIVALTGYGIYNKEQLNIWFSMNDHQQAANQFWFTQKNMLDENGETTLPFTDQVKTFDYFVSAPIQQDGKYYFETKLIINNQHLLPLYTAVKAVDGKWTVDTNETFASAGDASIQHYMNLYQGTLKNTHLYIKNLAPKMNKKEAELFIDKQLENIKTVFLDTYRPK